MIHETIVSTSSFDSHQCPLCGTTLVHNENISVYECPNVVVNPKSQLTHYTLFIGDGHARKCTHQMIVLPPFLLDTKDGDDKTRVYRYGNGGSNFIMNVPRINNWSDQQKIMRRIKSLLVFA